MIPSSAADLELLLCLILGVIGITDVTFIAAGGAKAVDLGEVGREDFLNKFQSEIEAEAA